MVRIFSCSAAASSFSPSNSSSGCSCFSPIAAFFQCRVRYFILAMSIFYLMLLFSNSILLNFTIICMEGPMTTAASGKEEGCIRNATTTTTNGVPNNGSEWRNENRTQTPTNACSYTSSSAASFSPFQRSALFSATAIGAIIASFPINEWVQRYSLRQTITGYGLVSALATLCTPICYELFGFPALFVARILQGTSFPAEYVMSSSLSRKWSPAHFIGTFLLLISTHFQFGPMYTMPVAGYFCQSTWGWSGIYYVQGAITLAFVGLFFAIFRDCPTQHPWVNKEELQQIQLDKTEDATEKEGPVPYRAILSDWAVWLLLIAFFSDELGFQIYTQLGPYYLNKVLGISVTGTGFIAAMPYMVSLLSKVVSGPINDEWLAALFSEHFRIKLFAAISQYGIALSLGCLAFLPLFTTSIWVIVPFYATLNMFTGLDFLGIVRCTQTIALRHAEVLIAWQSIVSSTVALVLPTIVSMAAPNDSLPEWMLVMGSVSLIVILSITAFMVFGVSSPRKWAYGTESTANSTTTSTKQHNKNSDKNGGTSPATHHHHHHHHRWHFHWRGKF